MDYVLTELYCYISWLRFPHIFALTDSRNITKVSDAHACGAQGIYVCGCGELNMFRKSKLSNAIYNERFLLPILELHSLTMF